MAILSFNVDCEVKRVWKWGTADDPSGYVTKTHVTDRGFITVWQTATSLEDVRDTLAGAGVQIPNGIRGYTIMGLKTKAGIMRNYGILLKELRSTAAAAAKTAKVEDAHQEAVRYRQDLRDLARLLGD